MTKKYIYSMMLLCFYLISTSVCFASEVLTGIGLNPTPAPPVGGNTIAGNIIGFMQWAGFAIAVGMLIYIGIKYVMASADEKANLKSTVIKFFVGAFLIVNATVILKLIYG